MNICQTVIYCCDQSWIFSIITPVFSVTWSFRTHSIMPICCSRNIYDYYQCWKQVRWSIVLWKPRYILFFRIHKMNRKWNEIVTLYISSLSLLINLMHPLWIKVFISFQNNHTDPKWYLLDSMISCMLLFCAVFPVVGDRSEQTWDLYCVCISLRWETLVMILSLTRSV